MKEYIQKTLRKMHEYFSIKVEEKVTIYTDSYISSMGKLKHCRSKYNESDLIPTNIIFDRFIAQIMQESYNKGIENSLNITTNKQHENTTNN